MKTATKIKDTPPARVGQVAAVYRLSEPVPYGWDARGEGGRTSLVWVSAADVLGRPETYIFPWSEEDGVLDWREMGGSFKGGKDHAEALRGLGFEIVEPS